MTDHENAFRAENCPYYGALTCNCEIVGCEGAWYCPDVEYITDEVMAYYNTNGDM